MRRPTTSLSRSPVLGVDVGGANIKLADPSGNCRTSRFALLRHCDQLGEKLREMLGEFPPSDRLAVTMTGELADCFTTRREGVRRIIEQIATVFPDSGVHVYAVNGAWHSPSEAVMNPWRVAASNWHALATWIDRAFRAEIATSSYLVVDVGSTTVDVIPMENHRVSTDAKTDRDRLRLGQLVYTGMERTPIAAIVRELTVNGEVSPVMTERFATSDDVYVALRLVAEHCDDCESADGRPRTVDCARARLARMVGEDSETLSASAIEDLAREILDAQAQQVASAIQRNMSLLGGIASDERTILATGHGRPLLERALGKIVRPIRIVWLEDVLCPDAARCAPAVAVACLLEQSITE